MKLNSNSAFNLLGIVCMVVLIGALMLAGWAGLSTTGIIVTGVVVAAIGNFVAIILLAKYSSEQNEPADGFHLDEVKEPRTALSTGIEIITGVLVAIRTASLPRPMAVSASIRCSACSFSPAPSSLCSVIPIALVTSITRAS